MVVKMQRGREGGSDIHSILELALVERLDLADGVHGCLLLSRSPSQTQTREEELRELSHWLISLPVLLWQQSAGEAPAQE